MTSRPACQPPSAATLARSMPEDRGPDSLDAHVRNLMADIGLYGYHSRSSKGSAKRGRTG